MKRKMFSDLRANQKGDTIVAIFLSVAIIGSVLALAYFLINRSFALNLRARQRNQVIKLVQGQVEGLKSLTVLGGKDASTPPIDIFDYSSYKTSKAINTPSDRFCLSVDNEVLEVIGTNRNPACGGLDAITSLESAEVNMFITYTADPDCGSAYAAPPVSPNTHECTESEARNEDLFKVRAEWDAYGSGKDNFEILIRLHPIQPPTP